jgi:hypothetical protein
VRDVSYLDANFVLPARLQWAEVVKVAHYRIDTQDLR